MKFKGLIAILFGVAMIYVWNYIFAQGEAKIWLWTAYLLMGFLVPTVYFSSKKSEIKISLILGIGFGLVASIIDIVISMILNRLSVIILMDSLMKIGIGLAGSVIFLVSCKVFMSERKFIFTTIGVLSKRIVAGIIDLNIILLIFAGLSILFIPIPAASGVISTGIIFIVFFYKAAHEIQYGQTPGKKIMGLKVSSRVAGILVRNIPLTLIFLYQYIPLPVLNFIYAVVAIDLLMMLSGKRLFDFLSGSSVVDQKA